LFGATRFLLFTGLALLLGAGVFLVLVARGTSAARRTRHVMWAGWVLILVTTIVGIALQGPYGEGSGIGDAVKVSVFRDILHTRYGHIAELRLLFLLVALPFMLWERRAGEREPLPGAWIVGSAAVGLVLAATPGLAGHADTGDHTIFAVPLDTLHVAAMAVWFGGLVALVVSALGGGFSGGLRRALIRFSALATTCVIVLVGTGVFASWRQVGFTIDGYLHTSYGNILLVKLGIVVALVGLATVSRSIVQRRRAAPLDAPDSVVAAVDERTVTGLRKSVGGEVLLGIGVLIATALLVNAQPARSALAPRLFSTTQAAGSGPQAMLANVIVDPAKSGLNTVHVYTQNPNGTDLPIRGMTGDFFLPAQNLKVPANLTRAGANHYLVTGLPITSAGKWQLVLHVTRVIDGEPRDTAVVVKVPIR
jgi:copper transport protein